jgi:hypothetical protein
VVKNEGCFFESLRKFLQKIEGNFSFIGHYENKFIVEQVAGETILFLSGTKPFGTFLMQQNRFIHEQTFGKSSKDEQN